jgi:hypothetical protein
MRRLLILMLAACAVGCTNDYGDFRFPKGAIPTADAGANTGSLGTSDAAPDGDR